MKKEKNKIEKGTRIANSDDDESSSLCKISSFLEILHEIKQNTIIENNEKMKLYSGAKENAMQTRF